MRSFGWLACAALVVVSCSAKNGNSDAVDQGSDANEAETNAESLSASFLGGSGTGTGILATGGELVVGDSHFQGLGDAAKAVFSPAGCLVVTDAPAQHTATYVFSGCTGPYGLVKITGTVTVDYSSTGPTELTLNYAAKGLAINGATIDWTATANITASGAMRDMQWNGMFSGTTRHGRAFSRTNTKHYTWTVGVPCLSVTGSSDGTVTGHELKTTIVSWSQCAGSCPEAGSEISIEDVTAKQTYDLKYGSGSATYTPPDGKSVTYTPLCSL